MTYTYLYASGPRQIDDVEAVEIRGDGSHTLICADQSRHLMPVGWLSYGYRIEPEVVAPVAHFVTAGETPEPQETLPAPDPTAGEPLS